MPLTPDLWEGYFQESYIMDYTGEEKKSIASTWSEGKQAG